MTSCGGRQVRTDASLRSRDTAARTPCLNTAAAPGQKAPLSFPLHFGPPLLAPAPAPPAQAWCYRCRDPIAQAEWQTLPAPTASPCHQIQTARDAESVSALPCTMPPRGGCWQLRRAAAVAALLQGRRLHGERKLGTADGGMAWTPSPSSSFAASPLHVLKIKVALAWLFERRFPS